jgi:hypothetical protein
MIKNYITILTLLFLFINVLPSLANDKADDLILEALNEREKDCKSLKNGRVYPTGQWAIEYKLKRGLRIYVVVNSLLPCKTGDSESDKIPIDEKSIQVIVANGNFAQLIMRGGADSYKVIDGKIPKFVTIELDGTRSELPLNGYLK